jgi:hypothetical protein
VQILRPWNQIKHCLEAYIGDLSSEIFTSKIDNSAKDDANFLDPSLLVDFAIYPHIYDLIFMSLIPKGKIDLGCSFDKVGWN